MERLLQGQMTVHFIYWENKSTLWAFTASAKEVKRFVPKYDTELNLWHL